MKQIRLLGLLLFLLITLVGCSAGKIPHQLVQDYETQLPRLIAVLGTANASVNPVAAELLRSKVIDGLYFKGYPRIPAKVIDALVVQLKAEGIDPSVQEIGKRLQIDALLAVTLKEALPGRGLFFAATEVAAEFEMHSVKTREILWKVKHQVVKRSYGITPKRVELKSYQVFEPAIQEVVDKALETLPDADDA